MGYYILGDSVSKKELCFMVGTFAGVSVLVLSKASSTTGTADDGTDHSEDKSKYLIGLAGALVGALSFSGISIITRKIKEFILVS